MKKFLLILVLLTAFISLSAVTISVTPVEPNTLTKGLDSAVTGALNVPPLQGNNTDIQVAEQLGDLNTGSLGLGGADLNVSSSPQVPVFNNENPKTPAPVSAAAPSPINGNAFRTMGAAEDSSSITTMTNSTSSLQTLGASHTDIVDIANSGTAQARGSSISEDANGSMSYVYALLIIGGLVSVMLLRKKDKAVNPVLGPPDGMMGPPGGPML